jgi:hypothetical protein
VFADPVAADQLERQRQPAAENHRHAALRLFRGQACVFR